MARPPSHLSAKDIRDYAEASLIAIAFAKNTNITLEEDLAEVPSYLCPHKDVPTRAPKTPPLLSHPTRLGQLHHEPSTCRYGPLSGRPPQDLSPPHTQPPRGTTGHHNLPALLPDAIGRFPGSTHSYASTHTTHLARWITAV
jgi:hypothetical protein